MKRRSFLRLGMALAALTLLSGHTPYRQWVVYRKKHLLVGCHRSDSVTYALAQSCVEVLATHLPEARARVARARDLRRLADLLNSDQLKTVILSPQAAQEMASGYPSDRIRTPVPLTGLAPLALPEVGERFLFAHRDLPARHAWLISAALFESSLTRSTPLTGMPLDWHPGSQGYLGGDPLPFLDEENSNQDP